MLPWYLFLIWEICILYSICYLYQLTLEICITEASLQLKSHGAKPFLDLIENFNRVVLITLQIHRMQF